MVAKIGIWVGMRFMSNHVADSHIALRHFSSPSRPTPPLFPAVNHAFDSAAIRIRPVATSSAMPAMRAFSAAVWGCGVATAAAGGYEGGGFA